MDYRRIRTCLGLAAAGLLTIGAFHSNALTIQYSATDLADAEAGKDLWRYTYYVSDYTFQAGEGFDIYFLQSLYRNLTDPQPDTGPDWFAASSVGPGNGAPLIYDAITLVADPSLVTTFSVDFQWLGQGTPGSQPFEAFRPAAAGGGLENFAGGNTSVPDSGSSLLLASMALGLLATPAIRKVRRAEA